jgi:hypothetical protein
MQHCSSSSYLHASSFQMTYIMNLTHRDSCHLDRSSEVAEHLWWERVAESPQQAHRSHEPVVIEELVAQQPAVE